MKNCFVIMCSQAGNRRQSLYQDQYSEHHDKDPNSWKLVWYTGHL